MSKVENQREKTSLRPILVEEKPLLLCLPVPVSQQLTAVEGNHILMVTTLNFVPVLPQHVLIST